MIPKVIHYVWLGRSKKPRLVEKAIESWRKYAPEYEIKEWNEDNFNLDDSKFLTWAMSEKKYAFASDFIRLAVLKEFGGVYLDTDMIMIQPMSKIDDANAELIIARLTDRQIFGAGLIMAEQNQEFISFALEEYKRFSESELTSMVANTERLSQWFETFYPAFDGENMGLQRVGRVKILPMREIYQPGRNSVMLHIGVASWKKKNLKTQISSLIRTHITTRKRLLLMLPVYNLLRRR